MGDDYHLAIIPDGNRRWATQDIGGAVGDYHRDREAAEAALAYVTREAPDYLLDTADAYDLLQPESPYIDALVAAYGHWQGAETAKAVWDWVEDRDVDEVTLWAFSRDNAQKRGDAEQRFLNRTFEAFARDQNSGDSVIHRNDIAVDIVGDTAVVDEDARAALQDLVDDTAHHQEGTLHIALGYDGRWDWDSAAIAHAREQVIDAVDERYRSGMGQDEVESLVRDALDAGAVESLAEQEAEHLDLPEIDILLAYGPDRSYLSHFADRQTGYATLHFPVDWDAMDADDLAALQSGVPEDAVLPKKHWPDAGQEDVDAAIRKHEYRSKTRGR